MKIGWIGTGLMGLPMARRVLEAGHRVTVYNRTASSAAPLVRAGASLAQNVAEAVEGHHIVVTTLPSTSAVEDVYLGANGIAAHIRPGAIAVDMSTSSPALARRIAAEFPDYAAVIDAPVSGGVAGAETGQLSIMVGGDSVAVNTARELFACVARTVVHHGQAGAGQQAKLVNQVLITGVTMATCEAFALAESCDLDIGSVGSSLADGTAGSRLFESLWSKLRNADMAPGFKLEHVIKDLQLILEEAAHRDVVLELVEHLHRTAAPLARSKHPYGAQALIETIRMAKERHGGDT